MFSWKNKIDEAEKQQTLAREDVKQAKEDAQKEVDESYLNIEKMKLAKFHCGVCGVVAQIPHPESSGGGIAGDEERDTYYNYNIPGDLFKCTACHEYTCHEHIYKGICQTCAEKM